MTLQWTTADKRRYSLHPNSISYNGSPFLKNQPTPTKSYNVQNLPSWLHFLIHMVSSTSDYWEWKLTHFLIKFRHGDCFLGATTSVFSSLKPQARRESETGRGIKHIIYTNATLMGTVERDNVYVLSMMIMLETGKYKTNNTINIILPNLKF